MSGPRRVLLTSDAVGGVLTYALELAEGLSERGVEALLLVHGPDAEAAALRARAAGLRAFAADWPLDWLAEEEGAVLAAGEEAARLAGRLGVDLVHLNTPAFAAEARFPVPVVAGCHSCLATWWTAVRGGEPPESFAWRIELVRRGYAAASALIAPSFAFVQATLAHYGQLARTVRNGRSAGARAFKPASKAPFVLTSGRLWDAGKNVAALERAAAAGLDVRAAGALEGPHGERAPPSPLTLLGPLDEASHSQLLNRALVYAAPALYEPFGLGVLEAAQAGCALVLSDIPSFRELWGEAAVFVPPDDPGAWRGALEAALSAPAEALALGARAAVRARRMTRARMTEETLAVYREALGETPAEAAA